MNVPEIRRELEGLLEMGTPKCPADGMSCYSDGITVAVVRVGLRACDEWDAHQTDSSDDTLQVIADILREAGVEVEG